jgi:uncharacterized protein (TIGR00369 family)
MTPKEMMRQFLRLGYPAGSGHPRSLGFEFVEMDEGRGVLKLPYRAELAGDAETGVLAGGAVTALLDHAAGLAVLSGMDGPGFTATLDLRIDYQRPATPGLDLFAEARCYRRTRTIAFVRAHAWDDDPDHPVATAQATFVLTGSDGGAA